MVLAQEVLSAASWASGLNDSVPFRLFLSEVARSRFAELDPRFATALLRVQVQERLRPAEEEAEVARCLAAAPR